MIGAYKRLPAYSDRGEFVLSMVVNGEAKKQRIPLPLTLVRPNKLKLETDLARVVCDGKTLTTVITPLKRYNVSLAPKTVTYDTVFAGGSPGGNVYRILSGKPEINRKNVLPTMASGIFKMIVSVLRRLPKQA